MADKPVWLDKSSEHGVALRALLWLESGRYNDDPCAWCRVGPGAHAPNCGLSFALKRHGLHSAVEREEARLAIEAFSRC